MKPTADQITRVVPLLGKAENLRRFFEQLENELWLTPLREQGFFDGAIVPRRIESTGPNGERYARYHPWPQSTYLLKIAAKDPAAVADVIVSLAGVENPWVTRDFLEAALRMPPVQAKRVAAVAGPWLKFGFPGGATEAARKLVTHLSSTETDAAFELASVLLEVWLPKGELSSEIGETLLASDRNASAYLEPWNYAQFLKNEFGSLTMADPAKAVDLLVTRLRRVLRMEGRCSREHSEDYSWIWYENLADDHRSERTPRHALVAGLRDTVATALKADGTTRSHALNRLSEQTCKVFLRMYIFSLSSAAKDEGNRVEQVLTNSALYQESGLGPELRRLLKFGFFVLTADAKSVVREIIDRGPLLEDFRERWKAERGEQPSESVCGQVAERWRVPYLNALRDHLTVEEREHLDESLRSLGLKLAGDEVDEGHGHAGFVGPNSPLTDTEIRSRGAEGMAEFAATWTPSIPLHPTTPSPEGLARVLTAVVSDEPDSYSPVLDLFRLERMPTIARAIVDGMMHATKKEKHIDWPPVLAFCKWIVNRPRDEVFETGVFFFQDPDWGAARKSIVWLLEQGFVAKHPIPQNCAEIVSELLSELVQDPDPSGPEEYGQNSGDPTFYAMNCVRGAAFIATMEYARWRARAVESTGGALRLTDMPEVSRIIQQKLDPQYESSIAVRSVFGQHLELLEYLEKDWVRSNLAALFEPVGEERLGQVVWESYLLHGRVTTTLLEVLSPLYRRTVEGGSAESTLYAGRKMQSAAGNHLMVALWWGLSDLHSTDSLVALFFTKCSDATRSEAVWFLERSMRNSAQPDIAVRDRLMDLWATRMASAESGISQQNKDELSAFGAWAASDWFDEEWRLQMLKRTLSLTRGMCGNAYFVAQYLAKSSTRYPVLSLECLFLMIKSEDEWGSRFWFESAPKVLQAGFGSDDPAARELAKEIGNYLGQRGFHQGTRQDSQ